ncbi:MAG: DUF935 family protein [Planctomycetaceae bacterium]|nr:DUF935 family protein [Planctomycetaceae bacterium]
MIATDTANGTNGHNAPASFLVEKMLAATERIGDGKPATPGAAPLHGQFPLPHVLTFQSIIGSISKVYRANDEAIRNSIDNARFMRNDCGVMECVEARQRAVSLLGWHIEPEDKKSQRQKDLCTEITKIISRIPRFDMYRYVLANAAWYGRYAVQNQYNWVNVGGRYYCLPHPEHGDHEGLGWLPINGDKIVFRYDDGTLDPERPAGQVGIRVGAFKAGDTIGGKWKVEATDRGMAYFLSPEERRNIAIHKHAIEDGAYEAAVDAGMIHGVGIRSRIYWDWFQKQECLAFLMEYLQRSAGGIELWYYDEGNPKAKAETEQAATTRVSNGGRNIILVPRPRGEDAMAYGVQLVEPGVQGVAELKDLLTNYFGHRIKRYILGQTLTSEADATGLGSGVAAAHIDTFMQIVKFDANGIDETLTRQLVRQIQLYNFPSSVGVWLRFKTETESPDVDKKLDACNTAFQMGARFKESDILDMVGMEAPGPDDRPLQSPAFQQQPGMPGAMPGAGGAGMPGMGKAGNDGASLMADKLHPTTVAVAMSASEETKRALFGGGKTSNPAADTGDRVRETDPEQYARSGDKCPVCPSCGSDNTSHSRTKGDANAECQECGKQFTDPDYGRPKSADEAAAETDRNPSDEQRASGNYRKGKFRVHGLTIAIETPKGAERRGKNREGQEWSVTMPVHYGYINRTEGKDGDHVDVFVGPHPESEIVFVVDQTTNGGRFDEHKILLGFTKQSEARDAYLASYSDDASGRIRDLTPMTVSQLRKWLESGDLSRPVSNQVSQYAKFREEDHPRDDGGQFTNKEGGTSRGSEKGTGFVSPNVEEGTQFDDAVRHLGSERHATLRSLFRKIDDSLELKAESFDAIGEWLTGAEGSVVTQYEDLKDFDELRYAMSLKGRAAKQMAVLCFGADDDGKSSLWTFTSGATIEELRGELTRLGIVNRTFVKTEGNQTSVHIVDLDSSLEDQVDQVAAKFEVVNVRRTPGQAEFVGSDDSRDAGVEKFDRVIQDYEARYPDRRRYRTPQAGRMGLPEDSERHSRERQNERLSVARYDRPASLEELPADIGKPATKKGGKGGSWVRLGGGAPAFVGPDGTIKKGCPGLKGENVEDLIDEPDESRDRRAAKQAHAEAKGVKGHEVTATETKKWEGQGAQRQHDAAKAAAKRHGVNVADVIQGLPEALDLRMQQWQQTEQARAAARRLAGMNAGNLARVENAYRDYSSVPGFDEAAASFAMEHTEMGLGRSGDVAAELWDFIREGAAPKPAIHDEETADMAAGMVGRRGQAAETTEADDEWSDGGGSWETSEDDSFDPDRFSKRNAPKPYSWNRT